MQQGLLQKQNMVKHYIAVLEGEIRYIRNQSECCDFSLETRQQHLLERRLDRLQKWNDSLAAIEAKIQALEKQESTD
jgi:hypothetical protein